MAIYSTRSIFHTWCCDRPFVTWIARQARPTPNCIRSNTVAAPKRTSHMRHPFNRRSSNSVLSSPFHFIALTKCQEKFPHPPNQRAQCSCQTTNRHTRGVIYSQHHSSCCHHRAIKFTPRTLLFCCSFGANISRPWSSTHSGMPRLPPPTPLLSSALLTPAQRSSAACASALHGMLL